MTSPDELEIVDVNNHDAEPMAGVRPLGSWLAVASVVTSTLLLVIAAAWYYTATRAHHVTRTVRAASVSGVDAGGCPAEDRCVPQTAQSPALRRAVERWFPGAEVLAAHSVGAPSLTSTYRQTVVFGTDGSVLTVVVGCVPGGAVVSQPGVLPPGTSLRGPRLLTVSVAGPRPGCSLSVTADVPASRSIPTSALLGLATADGLYS